MKRDLRDWILALLVIISSCAANKRIFYLPFSNEQNSKLIQGWGGQYGHVGHLQYAYDFIMPIGTPVLAAHSGTVIAFEERYDDNTKTPGQENFVIIDHGNGTFSRYYHLTKNGVLVEIGHKIKINDTIALSGNSGASGGPHLHFDITKDCYSWGCKTIEFKFKNSSENPLQAGKVYTPGKKN